MPMLRKHHYKNPLHMVNKHPHRMHPGVMNIYPRHMIYMLLRLASMSIDQHHIQCKYHQHQPNQLNIRYMSTILMNLDIYHRHIVNISMHQPLLHMNQLHR